MEDSAAPNTTVMELRSKFAATPSPPPSPHFDYSSSESEDEHEHEEGAHKEVHEDAPAPIVQQDAKSVCEHQEESIKKTEVEFGKDAQGGSSQMSSVIAKFAKFFDATVDKLQVMALNMRNSGVNSTSSRSLITSTTAAAATMLRRQIEYIFARFKKLVDETAATLKNISWPDSSSNSPSKIDRIYELFASLLDTTADKVRTAARKLVKSGDNITSDNHNESEAVTAVDETMKDTANIDDNYVEVKEHDSVDSSKYSNPSSNFEGKVKSLVAGYSDTLSALDDVSKLMQVTAPNE